MPFDSLEMRKFCEEFNIVQKTSSPRYPRGNGTAEKAVGTAKAMLKKNDIKQLDMCLMNYRNTPIAGLDLSPFELLLFRKVKNKLPIIDDLLKPKFYNVEDVQKKLREIQLRNKFYYDRNTVDVPECEKGEKIYFKMDKTSSWSEGNVVENFCKVPRSYIIQDKNNNRYRRNREHIFIAKSHNNESSNSVVSDNDSSKNNNQNQYSFRDRMKVNRPSRYS
uniref:Uncharacterized protein K02A2.6 n=2 Tax=Cacopsylla melanoneura TaxID=428564 RepID=A0A8D8SI17_9HEMI